MKLKRLKLENWRGVAFREIEFREGVTLIEGPNETGKSSLVEALLMLIKYKSSSAARDIKAVQPIGQDVGSKVEAEIETGNFHFVYSKSFNREKGTALNILSPGQEQLTGDEAHGRVEQILKETVDLALWEALLVDQGEKIAPVDIKDSKGLSRALDEAAGAGSIGEEDTDLFDAVQAEYEKYFTLKAGKARFESEEKAVETAAASMEAASQALREVDQYAEQQRRFASDVRSREQALPGLKLSAEDYETQWRDIDAVRGEAQLKEKEVEAAEKAVADAKRAVDERDALIRSIVEAEEGIKVQEKALEPKRAAIESVQKSIESAEAVLKGLWARRKEAGEAMSRAQADARHLRRTEQLQILTETLRELAAIAAGVEESAATVENISIDEAGLKSVRDTENELRVLQSQRDVAATKVTIEAEQDQRIEIGDERLTIPAAESSERQLASRTTIRLPGIAKILIDPPAAASDLESRVAESKATLDDLYAEYGITSAEDAAKKLARKQGARAELEQARRREQSLLRGKSKAELDEQARKLGTDVAAWEQGRSTDIPLPSTSDQAERAQNQAQSAFNAIEREMQEAETKDRRLRQSLADAGTETRDLEDSLIGQRAMLEDKRGRLEQGREATGDSELGEKLEAAQSALSGSRKNYESTLSRLEELNPERIESLFENSQAAWARAESELAKVRTELAILEDRLEQSQANGRFEQLEQARRDLDAAESIYASIKRRAEAAERLYTSLAAHRDAAHRAFVRPLKEAIERLGRIVFGNDFEVSLGEDWSIETRTLDGKTLPYDALSVGAREQLGILTRLAAAQIVSVQGGVPLIVDDALGFSDPARLETMGAAIAEAGKQSQVVILTCAPGRFSSVGTAAVTRF